MRDLMNLIRDEDGATAVEYGILIAGVAGVVMLSVWMLGQKLNNVLSDLANKLD
jgi:pilus assembly protein Flp/PilA